MKKGSRAFMEYKEQSVGENKDRWIWQLDLGRMNRIL